jgi:hypothetical protein
MNQRNDFTSRTTARVTALGLAAVVTLSILASVDLLATQPAADLQMSRQAAPAQVVATETVRPSNT